MLLSIVECSDYRLWKKGDSQEVRVSQLNNQIERVGPVLGPNAAAMRNTGAKRANGKWLFFNDGDCQINEANLLNQMERLEKSDFDLVGGVYRNQQKNRLAKTYNFIQRYWVFSGLKKQQNQVQGERLLGGALLVKKECWQSLNGFNEEIGWGAEELDFTQRALEKGFKAGVSYGLIVLHNNPVSFRGFLKRAWVQNYNRGYHGIDSGKKQSGFLGYFSCRMSYWLPVAFFFCIGSMAYLFGVSYRGVEKMWNV